MTGFTGTLRLVRLALRRDRIVLPAWILSMAAFLAATTAMFEDHYSGNAAVLIEETRVVVVNPGMRALGLVPGTSAGAYTVHRDALTLGVLAAVMSILAVIRHTRQAEELGREEMLAAGVVGRRASLAAAVLVALAANVVLAGALALAMVVAGQPVAGALVAGASIGLVGAVLTGVAAVTVQLMSTSRGASGLAYAVLGASFLLAALGNMVGTVDSAALRVTSAWPSWLSPIGWSQQMRPFGDNTWWPLGLAVLLLAGLFGLAVSLVDHRDVGRGMWAERTGPSYASRLLRSPEGLVWRLQRGALLGWMVAMAGFGLVFGTLSEQVQGSDVDATDWYDAFGGADDLLGAYWASMMQMAGTFTGIYVVTVMLRLHHDESRGTAEPLLGTSVSRLRWLGAYAVNAAVGALVLMVVYATAQALAGGAVLGGTGSLLRDMYGAALVQLPAAAALGAGVVTLVMVVPRWSVGLAWALVVLSVVVGPIFGPSLSLPAWLQDLSPFTHVPNAPAAPISGTPIVWLVVAGAVLAAPGLLALRRRDLALPA